MSGDLADIMSLAADMGRVSDRALKDLDKIVEKTALEVKKGLVEGAKWSPHFRGLASSITYDRHYKIGQVRYEIGPDKSRRGGALGNIFYFGTSRGGGTGDLTGQLYTEAPKFRSALAEAAASWADEVRR
jgi:hypothetical protein